MIDRHFEVQTRINFRFYNFTKSKQNCSLFVVYYVNGIAKICRDIKNGFTDLSHQAKWEYAKFKIREFSITFSKNKAKERKLREENLEKF